METVKLLREPGCIYDLFLLFNLKFNFKPFVEALANDKVAREENIKYFQDIQKQFGDIPDDLYVFFHANQNGCCFLTQYYFVPYKHFFLTEYNFKFLCNKLADQGTLVRHLIRFYFGNATEEEQEACATSETAAYSMIKASNYSSEVKCKLYEFFQNPLSYIQILYGELIEKYQLVQKYYDGHYQKILDVTNEMTYDALLEHVQNIMDLSCQDDNSAIYVSYCLLNKYCIARLELEQNVAYLLGYDYPYILEHDKKRREELDLATFGKAMCEENRVKILRYILKQKEVTCKDLEKNFDFSGSTTYHHLVLLLRAGVLETRNVGKTIFYRINRTHFKEIINELQMFATEQKE